MSQYFTLRDDRFRAALLVLPAFRDKFDFSSDEDFGKLADMALKAVDALAAKTLPDLDEQRKQYEKRSLDANEAALAKSVPAKPEAAT